MSLSLAIVLNVFLCLSLLTGLARVMALASRLTPHLPVQFIATAAQAAVVDVPPDVVEPGADVEHTVKERTYTLAA